MDLEDAWQLRTQAERKIPGVIGEIKRTRNRHCERTRDTLRERLIRTALTQREILDLG